MAKSSLFLVVLIATASLPFSELLAQSGSRGSATRSAPPRRPQPAAGGGSRFTQNQNRQIRANSGASNTSINSIINRDLSVGTATADVRSSFGAAGLASPFQNRGRVAASFGTVGNRPATKPFTGVTQSPTLSPFLGLFTDTFDQDTVNFTQFVQPQIQQQNLTRQVQIQQQQSQRLQQAQSQQQAELNIRLQQLAARPTFNPSGAQNIPPTGHSTLFNNTSRFYGGR